MKSGSDEREGPNKVKNKSPNSSIKQQQRASKGVAIFIQKSLKNRIVMYECISERNIFLRLKYVRGNLTLMGLYSPEDGKKTE